METNSPDRVLTPLEFIRQQYHETVGDLRIGADDQLSDIGLDSLELLELQLSCERHFGKHISDAEQSQIHTVQDLADAFS